MWVVLTIVALAAAVLSVARHGPRRPPSARRSSASRCNDSKEAPMRAMTTVVAAAVVVLSAACGGTDGTGEGSGVTTEVQALTGAATPAELTEGAWIGVRLGGGETPFIATAVHLMPPDRGEAGLHGTVAAFDQAAATFTVLGVPVRTDAATNFDGITAVTELADGRLVGLRGAMGDDGVFLATDLRVMEPELRGAIEAVTEGPDGVTVTVLGQSVLLPTGTTIQKGPGGHGPGMGGGACGGGPGGGRGGGHGRHGGRGNPIEELTGIDL